MRKLSWLAAVRKLKPIAPVLSLIELVACGSGANSNGGGGISTTNASPGGIWNGTDSASGLQVVGIVDEAGDFHFIRFDGVQYVGTAVTSGNSLSASFSGDEAYPGTFVDNSTHGTGSLSGTVQARTSISATTQFKTDNGTSSSGTLSLTFDSLYNMPSSLATIAGRYEDPNSADVITVTSAGDVSWTDAASGCDGSGTISIINATYNAYAVQFSYSNCTGELSVLNGVQFNGLATLNGNGQVTIGVNGAAAGTDYALVLTLNPAQLD